MTPEQFNFWRVQLPEIVAVWLCIVGGVLMAALCFYQIWRNR